MSARRSKTSTRIHNAIRGAQLVEQLERRLFLTTIITDTNPLTPTPATQTFEYKDARGNAVRVSVHGDVSAEFVFGRVTKGDADSGAGGNVLILGDHIRPLEPDEKGKLTANPEDGRDLFHVYVAQATLESFISIAQVPATGNARPMEPFTGAVTLSIQNLNSSNDEVRTMPAGTGNIYLGARTRDTAAEIENEANRPIVVSTRFHGMGLMPPNSLNRLIAGFSTAPDVTLGRFMFGGTVSGSVIIQGSMETFYCGNLLTGATQGQFEGVSQAPGNFYVAGDIRNILVKGAVGTDVIDKSSAQGRANAQYLTGTDFNVRGKVGQIKVGGDYAGTGTIYNTNPGNGLRVRQSELEVRIDPAQNRGSFSDFQVGAFGDHEDFFHNDDFDSAQYLGTINSKQTGENSIQVNGIWQHRVRVNDLGDFYAVGLMAGQQITVRLLADIVNTFPGLTTERFKSVLHVGVFDPDRRLIASDNTLATALTSPTTADQDPVQQEHFTFVTEKPGVYYFAVAQGAPTFQGGSLFTEQPYQLQITGVGKIGLGGMVVGGEIYGMGGSFSPRRESATGFDANIEVVLGDIGAVKSHDFVVSFSSSQITALAIGGNLRSFEAVSFGFTEGTPGETGVTLWGSAFIGAVTGSVGMIRTTGTDRDVHATMINDVRVFPGGVSTFTPPITIGGDIQYIVAPNTLLTDLSANGSIGVVQAAQFGAANYAGSLSANADGLGRPGVIDLIDVTLNMGTLSAGGPVISTGPGGNLRYLKISPTSTAYRPFLFGGSQPEETEYVQGQEARITDDSGAQVRIIPTQEPLLDPNTGAPLLDENFNPLNNSGTLTVLTYPIARSLNNRGGGGSAIIRITSTRGVTVRVNGGSAEIGEIWSQDGNAPGLVQGVGPDGIANTGDEDPGPDGIVGTADDPFSINLPVTLFGQPAENSVQLISDGPRSPIDVFMIRGQVTGAVTRVHFANIRNRTTGELAIVDVGQVGLLEANTLGWARSVGIPGLAVERADVADLVYTTEVEGNTFPFNQAKNAIIINGAAGGNQTAPAVATIRSREALGNIMILGRSEVIEANYDGVNVRGVHEGINGAIFAKGQLRLVRIGEGVMPSGTGNMAKAGIFAICDDGVLGVEGMGRVERVVGLHDGADIRGDIGANSGIGSVELSRGSIIRSDISVTRSRANTAAIRTGEDVSRGLEFGSTANIIVQGTAGGRVLGNIDRITTNGYGGILGLIATANNIGPVTSVGGFGIINSGFGVLGNGRFAPVVADGYGIRGSIWEGGQSVDSIHARGDGRRLTTTSFEPSLRWSEVVKIDPYFGTRPNQLTDLHMVIGTTKDAPQRKGTSTSGSIDLSTILVSRDAGTIHAHTMRLNLFNIANNISAIITDSYMDSVELTTGRIDLLAIGGDALRNDFQVAGPVGNVHVRGNFRGSSKLFATGQNGRIESVSIRGSLFGDIYSQQNIGSINVGRAFGSFGTRTANNMREFNVKGDVLTGAILTVEKELTNLAIGGNLEDGALVRVGTLGSKTILGEEVGVVDTKPWNT